MWLKINKEKKHLIFVFQIVAILRRSAVSFEFDILTYCFFINSVFLESKLASLVHILLKPISNFWQILEKKPFQFCREIWIQVVVILLQLYKMKITYQHTCQACFFPCPKQWYAKFAWEAQRTMSGTQIARETRDWRFSIWPLSHA